MITILITFALCLLENKVESALSHVHIGGRNIFDAFVLWEEPQDEADGTLVAKQLTPDDQKLDFDKFMSIMSGKLKLIDVRMSYDEQVAVAYFCDFEFHDVVKKTPRPRYSDFYRESIDCQEHLFPVPLGKITKECREYDKNTTTEMYSVEPNAFIFHQPKSGSTLLSNMLTVAHSDVLMISEPIAVGDIMKCEQCDHKLRIKALQDTMYLIGRTSSAAKKQMFVKISSDCTIGLPLIQDAFPNTKWIFLYRDTDVILQKLMNSNHDRRICGANRYNPSNAITKYMLSNDQKISSMDSDEQGCAMYLLTLKAIAIDAINSNCTSGKLVDYSSLLNRDRIKDLFQHLSLLSIDWDKIEEERRKRSNIGGKSGEWNVNDENIMQISDKVKSVTLEFER